MNSLSYFYQDGRKDKNGLNVQHKKLEKNNNNKKRITKKNPKKAADGRK